jgi:hypothetical protein
MNLLPKITKITIEQYKKENESVVTTTSIPYELFYWKGKICYNWLFWNYKLPFKNFDVVENTVRVQNFKIKFLLEIIYFYEGKYIRMNSNTEPYVLKRKLL